MFTAYIRYFPNSISLPYFSRSSIQTLGGFVRHFFTRKAKMHSDILKPFSEGWVPPTCAEIAEFKKAVGWSTNELAALVDVDPKHLRNYLKEKTYIQGKRIQYSTWRFWLESFGIVEPLKLEPTKPYLQSKIFSSDKSQWREPVVSELRVLVTRSGYSDSAVARFLEIEEPLIKHLLHSPKKVGNSPFHVKHEKWMFFLGKIGISSLTEYKNPPNLPEACLKAIGEGYEPPNPKDIRQFAAWTGRTPSELAAIVGEEESRLGFFMSNRSTRQTDATIEDRVFGVEDWRAPNFKELRTFMNILSLDPMEIAHRLKLSKQEMTVALATRDNGMGKERPLPVTQEDWFKLLDSLKVFNTDKIKKLTAREGRAYYIQYSIWRLLLQSFGLVEPLKLERKI